MTGADCLNTEQQPSEQTISHATYSDQETGIYLDFPTGSTLRDGVNGFEDVWKFQYEENGYVISFNQFKEGAAIYADWDDPKPARAPGVHVVRLDSKTIYSLKGTASAEAYFINRMPTVSIRVSKHEGEVSSSEDAVYQHLVDSIKMNNE